MTVDELMRHLERLPGSAEVVVFWDGTADSPSESDLRSVQVVASSVYLSTGERSIEEGQR